MEEFPREFLPESLFDAETDAQRIYRNEAIAKDAYERAMRKYTKGKMFKGLQSREMGKRTPFLKDVYERQVEEERVISEIPTITSAAITSYQEAIEQTREQNRSEPMEFQVYIERISDFRNRIAQAQELQERGIQIASELPDRVTGWLGIGAYREPDLINYPPPVRYAD